MDNRLEPSCFNTMRVVVIGLIGKGVTAEGLTESTPHLTDDEIKWWFVGSSSGVLHSIYDEHARSCNECFDRICNVLHMVLEFWATEADATQRSTAEATAARRDKFCASMSPFWASTDHSTADMIVLRDKFFRGLSVQVRMLIDLHIRTCKHCGRLFEPIIVPAKTLPRVEECV